MQLYDLIMLIVLSMATIFGAIKGFAWQVASLASIIVSYAVAYRFRFDLAEMIQAAQPWNQFLAMLILYVGTSFVIWVGFRLLSGVIDKVKLKDFDRHLGAAFGLAKGLVYCLLITMFSMSLLGPNQQAAICQSKSGFYIASALDRAVGVLPSEIHDIVGPYLAKLDGKFKQGRDGQALPLSGDESSEQTGLGSRSILPGGLPGDNSNLWSDALQNLPNGWQELPGDFVNSLRDRLPANGNLNPASAQGNSWASGDSSGPNSGAIQNTSPQVFPPQGFQDPSFSSSGFSSQDFPPLSTGSTTGQPAFNSGNNNAGSMNPGSFPGDNGLRPGSQAWPPQQAQLPVPSLPR